MIETILNYLKEAAVPPTAEQLADALDTAPQDMQIQLARMQSEGAVIQTKKHRYALPEQVGLFVAVAGFQHNGSLTARPVNGDRALQMTVHGGLRPMPDDLILARMTGDRCELDSIIARRMQTLPAFIRIEKRPSRNKFSSFEDKRVVTGVPCDLRIPYDIVVKGDTSFVKNDQLALVRIDVYPEQNRPIYGTVERILGQSGSMLAMMRSVAEGAGFPTEPDEKTEAEAEALSGAVTTDGRADLRDRLIFTIDGATAKDFDDAVSLEAEGDILRLGVHIADVAHYVRPRTAIDEDAAQRSTSVYLPGLTVPMLPERLCNDLCSLRPDEDRYALSLYIDFKGGKIVDHTLTESVIRSHARLTYAEVNRLFSGEDTSIPQEIADTLFRMKALAETIRAARDAAGQIDLDLPEADFVLNEECVPTDILLSPRGDAERLIEDFMLSANAVIASIAKSMELPIIYRVHETPDPERLRTLEQLLSTVNLQTRLGDAPHPGQIAKILLQTEEHPARDVIRQYVLRSMSKARYSENPLGHYALAMPDYCHFTSPIRRYPDLVTHRMLKRMLHGELPSGEGIAECANACSAGENRATGAERQADSIMKAKYMSTRIGHKYAGTVTGVTGWGLYVTLPNGVEGLVPITTMDDYYEYNRDRSCLYGTSTGTLFRLGDRVRVCMDHADVIRGDIAFLLCN